MTDDIKSAVADLAQARATLERFEVAALKVLNGVELGKDRGIVYAAKEAIHAARLVAMEASERVKQLVGEEAANG